MKRTPFTARNRFEIAPIALALTVAVLPGLVHPQPAEAQGRRAAAAPRGGGARPRSFAPYTPIAPINPWGGGFGEPHPNGFTPYHNIQPRTPTSRFDPTPRTPNYGGTPSRLNSSPTGGYPQPVHRALPVQGLLQPVHRVAPIPGIHALPYTPAARLYPVTGLQWTYYFPAGAVYYPNYYLNFTEGITAFSLYYYYGTFPAFIGLDYLINQPPPVTYIPYPVYIAGQYHSKSGEENASYYLNQKHNEGEHGETTAAETTEQPPALMAAISDITTAWTNNDIRSLARHINKDATLAVYLRGKYCYSLTSADYLNMTRDALATTKTIRFTLDKPQHKEKEIYTVTGRHTYTDKENKNHTVVVSYVFDKTDDDYYLSQVGTAPEKLEE